MAEVAPKYHRIAGTLQLFMDKGIYPPKSRLQPESRLTEIFHASRSTIRQAIDLLNKRGYLDVRQGDGTFVRRPPEQQTDIKRDSPDQEWRRVTYQMLIAGDLVGRILEEEFLPGAPLPKEFELIDEYSRGRNTVREALKILQTEAVISIEQGKGSFVNKESKLPDHDALVELYTRLLPTETDREKAKALRQRDDQQAERPQRHELASSRLPTETKLQKIGTALVDNSTSWEETVRKRRAEPQQEISVNQTQPPEIIAKRLGIPPTEQVYTVQRTRLEDGNIYDETVLYIPEATLSFLDISAEPPWNIRTISQQGTGQIGVREPTPAEMERFRITADTSLLTHTITGYNEAEIPTAVLVQTIPSDRGEIIYAWKN